MIAGAVLLFYRTDYAPRGELWFVVAAAATTALVLAALSYKAISVQNLPDRTGTGVLIGRRAPARTEIAPVGLVFVDGALWEARSEQPIAAGEPVEIVAVEGLTVLVKPGPKGETPPSARKESA
jgi:membrane-bound serine protease (ClpP class)